MVLKILAIIVFILLSGCGSSDTIKNNLNKDDVYYNGLAFKDESLCVENTSECHHIPGKTYMYSVSWDGGYYVILYDGSLNVASSSGQNAYFDGFEVYFLKDSKLIYKSNFFYESSIDSFFRSITFKDSLVICASKECISFMPNGETNRLSAKEVGSNFLVTGLQLTETMDGLNILFKGAPVTERVGILDESEYEAYSVLLDEFFIIQSINNISIDDLLASIFIEIKDLKQPFFLAQDNKEGRISWGQHYIIDWYILSLKYGELSENSRRMLDANFTFYFEQDLRELMLSRRYSMWRADALFLLHVSRFRHILENYREIQNNVINNQIINQSSEIINNSFNYETSETEEVLQQYYFEAINETVTYLKFSRDSVFWADGANVPVNYTSDYIVALIKEGGEVQLEMAESLLNTHLKLIGNPINPSWLYWYGDGLVGWSDDSSNTPVYEGDKFGYASHISYRSADAMAFLEYCKLFPGYDEKFDCSDVRQQLYELILLGNLEPHLLRFFDDKNQEFSSQVISRFAQLSYLNDLRNLLFLK